MSDLEDFGTWVADENGTQLQYTCRDEDGFEFDLSDPSTIVTLEGTSAPRGRTLLVTGGGDDAGLAIFDGIPAGASAVPGDGEGSDLYECRIHIIRGGAHYYARPAFTLSIAEKP